MTTFILKSKNSKVFNRNFILELKPSIPKNTIYENPNEAFGFIPLLNEQRNQIDKINSDLWKKIRWYINDCDFLVKDPIINRAFYKYWEIIQTFSLYDDLEKNDLIFHCAEAPGGFIQSSQLFLSKFRKDYFEQKQANTNNKILDDGFITIIKKKKQIPEYKIFSISLNRNLNIYKKFNLPSYNSKIVNKYTYITYGSDNTGNINNWDNILFIKNKLKVQNTQGFKVITCDGGMDEGNDFNNKEQLHNYLILNEILSTVFLQQEGGHFILKMFDIFTETSIHLLYLLTTLYESVYIYKPKTSRPTNSEKYIICKNFTNNTEYISKLMIELKSLSDKLKYNNNKYYAFKIFINIPDSFIEKVKQMNHILVSIQCDYLNKAIILCNDVQFINKYDSLLSKSLQERINIYNQWATTYMYT